jgi:hypothetical protein
MRDINWYVERNEKLHNEIREYEMREALLKKDVSLLIKGQESLCAKLEIAKQALKSIASLHRSGADTIDHWLNLSHEQCAQTNVNDTIIARTAFEAITERSQE